MTCPICGGTTKVVESRKDVEGVYRARKCYKCHYIFHTAEYESPEALERLREIQKTLRK